jgi:hypothetical protein
MKAWMRPHARCLVFVAVGLFAGPYTVRAEVDFGDHSSSTLTTKAWDALGTGDLEDALAYVAKCISMYEAEAKKMQASLTDYPSNDPKEETFKYWALNDVGTCYFIKGEVLLKKGDTAGAKTAFETCANDFKFCQCWDPKGWFWKPADAARQKVVELEYDEE